jgi:ketosteroid isomerase-like protein
MPPGSIELVRSCWAAVAAGDHEPLVAACDPAVVWDLSRLGGWDGEPVAHGRDGVRAVLAAGRWTAGGTCVAAGPRVLLDAHDHATAAVVHEVARGGIVRLASITGLWEAQLALTGSDPAAIVRAVWDTWEARDMDRVIACFADDVVFDLSLYEAWPGEPQYHGPTSMIAFLAQWMSWWHGYRQELVGLEVLGSDVLLVVRHGGRRESARVDELGGLVYGMCPDGRIGRWTAFAAADRARAWSELRQAPAQAQ